MNKRTTDELKAEEVIEYLYQNPLFFHAVPELLNAMRVPHPTTGHEISLLERQVLSLRQQKETLETEIEMLTHIAGENVHLLQKVRAFIAELMRAQNEQQAVEVIYQQMTSEFAVPHVALFSWEIPQQQTAGLHQLGMSPQWLSTLREILQPQRPVCGGVEAHWQKGLFPQVQQPIASTCLIPLGEDRVWGVLALGSEENRFAEDQGTYFLAIMGEMITARLERLFAPIK